MFADGLLVARVPSSRDPRVVYEVRLVDGVAYTCTCPGFGFRRSCRHVAALAILGALPIEERGADGR